MALVNVVSQHTLVNCFLLSNHLEQSSWAVKTSCCIAWLYSMDSSSNQLVCVKCGVLFAKNKNLLRHVRTIHQGMKRTVNEKRKEKTETIEVDQTIEVERKNKQPLTKKIKMVHKEQFEDSSLKPEDTRYKYHLKTEPESTI